MNYGKYELISEALTYQSEIGELDYEEAAILDDEAYIKYVLESEANEEANKSLSKTELISKADKINKEANDSADTSAKTWGYKTAIRALKGANTGLKSVSSSAKSNANLSAEDKSEVTVHVNELIKKNESKIKELSTLDRKKQLRRFDNKYWINYTKEHRKAFAETEKELLGHNTERGLKHDYDKLIMYHFLPPPIAHALHVTFAKHHKRRARTKEDYEQMMVDWECNRKTKPDKQMKPYQVIDKFYPELKSTMIPILKEHGLPTNAQEDAEMYKKDNKVVKESVAAAIGKHLREKKQLGMVKKIYGPYSNKCLEYDNHNVSDSDYEKIKECMEKCKSTDQWVIYKKYFKELTSLCGLNPSVIVEYKCEKGDEPNKNHVYMKYENKNKTVPIPQGYRLWHYCPVPNLRELEPHFRGKAPRYYLYSSPRIYCTIKEFMPRGFAQYKGAMKKVQTTKYVIDEKFNTAVLDDRIGSWASGAVYIETLFPVKVKKASEVSEASAKAEMKALKKQEK